MCIIASIPTKKGPLFFKNRDRNYKVHLKACHLDLEGRECLVIADALTEWIEGMNDAGVCIVNSALMVGRDEKEKKKSKKGKKSKDGARILRALRYTRGEDILDSLLHFKGGVKGHTFVSTPTGLFALETTSKHEAIIKELNPDALHIRTNHGHYHPEAGYREGENYFSSKIRMELARRKLEGVKSPSEIIEAINEQVFELNSPYNMVRRTERMRTSSQIVMNPNERSLYIHHISENTEAFTQIDLRKNQGQTPKLSLKII